MKRWPHSPATTWRRAIARCDRRSRTYLADKTDANARLLAQAVRLSNTIYRQCVDRSTPIALVDR